MAARLIPVLLVILLAAPPVVAGVPVDAGVARAVSGDWQGALTLLDAALPAPGENGNKVRYFRAAALLALGERSSALEGLRRLSDGGGPFSGPALELGVQTLFIDGRHRAVVAWTASSRAERFQDPDALHYRVGQSHLLSDQRDVAQNSLRRVASGPYLPYALHSLALLQVAENRFGPAVDLLGEAITAAESVVDPRTAAALADALRVDRGRVLYQLGANAGGLKERERSSLAELARKQFERVGEGSTLYPDALRGIGWCSLESGDSSRALASFVAAGGMDSAGRPEDLWAQGRVYQRLEFLDEAARLYGQAGRAAVELADALDAGEVELTPAPVPQAARWEARGARAARVGAGRDQLDERLAKLERTLVARSRRLEAAGRNIDRHRRRAEELHAELVELAARLQEFLDNIPAAALFPLRERGRITALAALQQRLNADLARTEGALGAIGGTVFWTQARDDQRARGRALWARLGVAKETLGELQLGFLIALKKRVSVRETELAQQIEKLQAGALGLAEPVQAAERQRLVAEAAGESFALRVAALRARSESLDPPLAALDEQATVELRKAEMSARTELARQLRLSADTYALDETQALHLLQQRGSR